jgi:predicted O-methyltransferase YrrM
MDETPRGPRKDWDGLMHGGNWLKWLGHLKDKPAVGLEVGTFYGESAEWMLDNIFTHNSARYLCVDTFEGSAENVLGGMDCSHLEEIARARLARFGDRVQFAVGPSNKVLECFLGGEGWPDCHYLFALDFALIDGAHDAQNVLRDGVLAFDLLKVGGVMIFDDYSWRLMPDAIDCPKMAIDAFATCYGRQIEVLGLDSQLAVKKIR